MTLKKNKNGERTFVVEASFSELLHSADICVDSSKGCQGCLYANVPDEICSTALIGALRMMLQSYAKADGNLN